MPNRYLALAAPALAAPALAALALMVSCKGEQPATAAPDTTSTTQPGVVPTYTYTIVATVPHDTAAFTEGLFIKDGQLYESTGLEGKSDVRRVDLSTGAVVQRRTLPAQYFGEGIVAFGDRLYELTWKNQKAFVYDLKTFAPVDTFTYYGEGWALTTDGTSLYMSDGTARLRVIDPKTFAVQRTIDVHEGNSPYSNLNELEWYKGELLANVWQANEIVRIDPKTGAITGHIDLTGLPLPADKTGHEDVLNGIAYDAATDRLFVTGKNFAKMYQIAIKQR
jgi:glutaminyl-peptide cyclotransferase